LVLVQDTFGAPPEDEVRPVAENVHRHNEDVPQSIIEGWRRSGRSASRRPRSTTASRPEILSRALVTGGTEEQKRAWLPRARGAKPPYSGISRFAGPDRA
jgi:(2S)-methylsuccinyl-CoA dehydrogenase